MCVSRHKSLCLVVRAAVVRQTPIHVEHAQLLDVPRLRQTHGHPSGHTYIQPGDSQIARVTPVTHTCGRRILCRFPNLVHRQATPATTPLLHSCAPLRDGESRWQQIDSRHAVASMMTATSQAIAARLISERCWGYSRIECQVLRA